MTKYCDGGTRIFLEHKNVTAVVGIPYLTVKYNQIIKISNAQISLQLNCFLWASRPDGHNKAIFTIFLSVTY